MSHEATPKDSGTATGETKPTEERRRFLERINVMSVSQVGLFVIAAICALYFVRPVLLPLILALLITLLLKPIQRRLETILRMPSPLAAGTVMAVVVAGITVGLIYLATPAANYASKLHEEIVQNRLRTTFKPITTIHEELADVAEKVEVMTTVKTPPVAPEGVPPAEAALEAGAGPANGPANGAAPAAQPVKPDRPAAPDKPAEPGAEAEPKPVAAPPVKVEIRENRLENFYEFAQAFSLQAFITFALVFFFLAFGDKLIRRLAEVDFAAELIDDITRDVSHYLLTITTINAGLGIVTAVAMGVLGMPNPILWGVMAAFLNYIPYLGAIAGSAIVCVVAAISFEYPSQILPVPIVYYLLTAIEGYFITPTVIGRRFTMNPIIVFVWVLSWGALWGIPGMLIALPFLMVFRIICAKLPSLSRLERVLSA